MAPVDRPYRAVSLVMMTIWLVLGAALGFSALPSRRGCGTSTSMTRCVVPGVAS